MVDKNTEFFKVIDNFEKTRNIESICIIKSNLDFVPKVTIGIPTFKRADLLKESIDSALNQEQYKYYDIIIVDNNPERGCENEQLMLSYTNERISYYKNSENLGMAGNWNRIFELAIGDYVVLLHDDDLIFPGFLTECMFYVENEPDIGILKPTSITFNSSSEIDDLLHDTRQNDIVHNVNRNNYKLEQLFDFSNTNRFFLGAPTGCLFNKKAVIKMGGFNQELFPTFDFCFVVLFSIHYKVFILNKPLSFYRLAFNESLKIETLRGFIINDFYLTKAILKKYKFPNFIIDKHLGFVLGNKIEYYKTFNENFSFDLFKLLGLKDTKKSFFVFNFMRIYLYVIKRSYKYIN